MRILVVIMLLLLKGIFLMAQSIPPVIMNQMTLSRMSTGFSVNPNDITWGVAAPAGRVISNTYIDKKWNIGSIVLLRDPDHSIGHYPLKFDVQTQSLEILSKGNIKLLPMSHVKYFAWTDSITQETFYFANDAELLSSPTNRPVRIVSDGKVPLIEYFVIQTKEPTYEPALNIGNKDKIVNVIRKFAFVKNRTLYLITSKKNLIKDLDSSNLSDFLRANDLSTKSIHDLKAIFTHYNSQP